MHRLQGEDSWLGSSGIQKRENLAKKIEEKAVAAEKAAAKAEEDRLAMEKANTDATRVGIFDVDPAIAEANRRQREEMEKIEDEKTLDPRVGVFYRDRGEKKNSWFGWWNVKSGEEKQVEAAAAQTSTTPPQ
jgi:hypothetical protein